MSARIWSDDAWKGIGKPEPLTGDLQGEYSRRINERDRLIYDMEGVPRGFHLFKAIAPEMTVAILNPV